MINIVRFTVLFLAVQAVSLAQFQELLDSLEFRNLGPFRAGGWVSDVAVPDSPQSAHEKVLYVGARSGGVWKSVNAGTTFEPASDSIGIASVGALAVAPSNADIVWLGSGDASATRSAYHGNGIYRSVDGAKTWKRMGLEDTQHIARIAIHPSNSEVILVAALGPLYSPSQARGIFRSTDGGVNWTQTLYVNDTTGGIDMVRDPRNPDIIFAATYDAQRQPWRLRDGGPGSGIHKSLDGGISWKRLEQGLPTGQMGRIGLDIARSQPDTVYAILEDFNQKPGNPTGRNALVGGGVYRSDDGGATWRKTSRASDDLSRKSGYAFNQIRVAPDDPSRIFITGSNLISSGDGGATWEGLANGPGGFNAPRPFRRAFGDFRVLWIDSKDPSRMIAGSDGGIFVSHDGGKTCDHLMNIPLGEIYALGVDNETPYRVFAGLQDHESWMGPSNGPSGSIGIEDWKTVGIGDGMYNEPDPNGRYEYNDQEFGTPVRIDLIDRTRTVITPAREQGQPAPRVNWTAPLRISPHDSKTVYFAANVVFRSKDRGDHWDVISPDLTTNDPAKISGPGSAIQHCTIVTLAESQAKAGVIWVGTDDGKVQVTRDSGATWLDRTSAISVAGGPADAWVTRVFPSRFLEGVAYVTKNRRRHDDFRVFVYRTDDFGATWTNISNGLPSGAANVIAEDVRVPSLLFLGTDAGLFTSFDSGANWRRVTANLSPAPVTDLTIHARESDLILGTFGRGLWITNIAALREFPQLGSKNAHLFEIQKFAERREVAWGNYRLHGDRNLTTPNDPNGMRIAAYFQKAPAEEPTLIISDASGKEIFKQQWKAKAGLNRTYWFLDNADGTHAPPGEYMVTLSIGGVAVSSRQGTIVSRAPADQPRQRRRPGAQN